MTPLGFNPHSSKHSIPMAGFDRLQKSRRVSASLPSLLGKITHFLRYSSRASAPEPKSTVEDGSGTAVIMSPATFVREPDPPAGAVPPVVGSTVMLSAVNGPLTEVSPYWRLELVKVPTKEELPVSVIKEFPNQLVAVSDAWEKFNSAWAASWAVVAF